MINKKFGHFSIQRRDHFTTPGHHILQRKCFTAHHNSWNSLGKWLRNETHASAFFMTGIALARLWSIFFCHITVARFMILIWYELPAVPLCLIAIHWKCNFDQMQTNVIEQTKWVNSLHFRTFKLKVVSQLYKYCRYLHVC